MAEGYSFTPGLANRFRAAVNGQGSQLPANATQALQILSLHLPDVIGGHAPAPDALLRGGSGLTPDTAVRAMSSGQSAAQPSPSPASKPLSAPGPNQPPLSVSSPPPTFDSAPAPAPSQQSDMGGGGGGNASAPNPFPSAPVDPGPTPSQPNTNSTPAFRFKQDDFPQEPAAANTDLQGLMQQIFGSSFLQSMFGGGGQDYQNFQN